MQHSFFKVGAQVMLVKVGFINPALHSEVEIFRRRTQYKANLSMGPSGKLWDSVLAEKRLAVGLRSHESMKARNTMHRKRRVYLLDKTTVRGL